MQSAASTAFLSTVATTIPILVVGTFFASRTGVYARLMKYALNGGAKGHALGILAVISILAVMCTEMASLSLLVVDVQPSFFWATLIWAVTVLLFIGFVMQLIESVRDETLVGSFKLFRDQYVRQVEEERGAAAAAEVSAYFDVRLAEMSGGGAPVGPPRAADPPWACDRWGRALRSSSRVTSTHDKTRAAS